MSGLLDPLLYAVLRRGGSWFPLVEIDSTLGTTLRYTKSAMGAGGVASKSLGLYESRVSTFGTIGRAASDRTNSVQSPTGNVTLDDHDRAISRIAPYILRQPVRIKIASPEVPASAFFTYFKGILSGYTQGTEDWQFALRQNDLALDGQVPRRRFSVWDWPNIDKRVVDQVVPIVYGSHDRSGFPGPWTVPDGKGMLPAFRLDNTRGLYGVAGHFCQAVPRVYVGTTLKIVSTDYAITYPVRNGNQYTCIDFVIDPGPDAVVTCDVDGIGTSGTGIGGTLITNPATIWGHLLSNWVLNNYTSGAYFSTHVLLSAADIAIAEHFFAAFPYTACRWIGDAQTGRALSDEWAQCFEAQQFWTNAGTLSIRPSDSRYQEIYDPASHYAFGANPWLRWDEFGQGDSLRLALDDQAYGSSIRVSHAFAASDSSFLDTTLVQDASKTDRGIDLQDNPWLPASANHRDLARDVLSRRINRFNTLISRVTCTSPIHEIDTELLIDGFLSWDRGWAPGSVGWGVKDWQRVLVRRMGTQLNLDTGDVDVAVEVIRNQMTTFHHSGRSRATAASAAEDGLFVLSGGGARSMTRASKRWADDPGGYVVEQAPATLPVSKDGIVIEPAITNELTESSFVDASAAKQYLYPDGTTLTLNSVESAWGEGHAGDLILHPVVDDDHAVPDDDTSYVLFNASVLQNDGRFSFGNLTGTPTIVSVTIRWRWNGGAGTIATAIPYLRVTGTNYDGTSQTPVTGVGYLDYSAVYATNPATGIAWTVAQVNALEGGIRIDSAGGKALARLTSIYLEVQVTSSAVLYNAGGGGQGTIVFDALDSLFVNTNGEALPSVKFTAATPAQASNLAISVDSQSIAANAKVRVSMDIKNVSGGLLYWFLQRLVDNFFWNDTTQAWQAGVIDNPVNGGIAASVITRFKVGDEAGNAHPIINIGTNASVLRLFVYQRAGFVNNGQVDRVYHLQIEKFDAWTSRKVSSGNAPFVGAADVLLWTNDDSFAEEHAFPPLQGTLTCAVVPSWSTAATNPTVNYYVFSIVYDANNAFFLRWSSSTSAWEFIVKRGGSTFTVLVQPPAFVSGSVHTLACRWTSSHAELDLPAFTASLWVDGVKGTDVNYGSAVTPTAGANFNLGSNVGAEQFTGAIRDLHITPFVLADAEVTYVQPG